MRSAISSAAHRRLASDVMLISPHTNRERSCKIAAQNILSYSPVGVMIRVARGSRTAVLAHIAGDSDSEGRQTCCRPSAQTRNRQPPGATPSRSLPRTGGWRPRFQRSAIRPRCGSCASATAARRIATATWATKDPRRQPAFPEDWAKIEMSDGLAEVLDMLRYIRDWRITAAGISPRKPINLA